MTQIDADDSIGKSPMSQKSPGLIPLVFGHATNVASYLRPVNDYPAPLPIHGSSRARLGAN